MLIEIKKLVIITQGHGREIFLSKMFINSTSVVSISNYSGAESFLTSENSTLSGEQFSLVKILKGAETEDIIVHGSAESLYSSFTAAENKKILNG